MPQPHDLSQPVQPVHGDCIQSIGQTLRSHVFTWEFGPPQPDPPWNGPCVMRSLVIVPRPQVTVHWLQAFQPVTRQGCRRRRSHQPSLDDSSWRSAASSPLSVNTSSVKRSSASASSSGSAGRSLLMVCVDEWVILRFERDLALCIAPEFPISTASSAWVCWSSWCL